jgi:RimJ/RimL family protein N-acetyltransferase
MVKKVRAVRDVVTGRSRPKSGGLVYLRALEADDLPRTHAWHNDPALYRTLIGDFHFVSRATEQRWLETVQSSSASQVNLAICRRDNARHVGNIYLRDIDWRARHGDVHLFLGDVRERGQGLGEAALRLMLAHAFDDLGLNRVHLRVLADNTPALRLYRKLGFTIEGRLRCHAFKCGRLQDVLCMGLLRDDRARGSRNR